MKGLMISFVLLWIFIPGFSQVNLSNGLVAYYPFTGNANDVSGNNHNGQMMNGPQLTADRFGSPNSAYLFDGIDDFIRVTDNGDFSTPHFSLVIWFQSQSDALQNLVGKRDFNTFGGTAGAQYQFFINYSQFPGIGSNLVGNTSSCANIVSSSYLNTDEWICRTKWYCAVITYDGNRHKIYIDGVLKRDEPTSFSGFLQCSSDLRFGNWWQGDLLPFKGLMDDIRWYNRALNQEEVTALYANFTTITGQCSPTSGAGFLTPDTVCVNTPVAITNTTVNATNYYWNFCVANSTTDPKGTNLGNFGFSLPVFSDYVKDGNNYYALVTNNMPGKLTRLDFGNSLLNTPQVRDFGNLGGVIPDNCEGLQIVNNQGRWYAIIVGGNPVGRIVKVDFGATLSNNSPVATNWGNVGNLAYPTDLHVFQDGANWYGLTINAVTSTITRFNFTSSFTNTPTATNLGNIGGLNYPTGIYAIKNNGTWHAFVSNAGSGNANSTNASLTRLDFGSSLLNVPTGVNLGNPGNTLSSSRDLTIYQSCSEIFGFVVNNSSTSDIVRLNFNNDLSAVPSAASLGNTGNLSFPHSISKLFRVENDLYAFITNVDNNTITRLKFGGCGSSSISSSTLQNPPPVTYNAVGTYTINLTVDDGLPTQSAYCKTIVVIDNKHTPLQHLSICSGDSVLLTSSRPSGNTWSTGETSSSIYVKAPGTYWVRSSAGGCVNTDSFKVAVAPVPIVNLGDDTTVCSSDQIVLDAGNPGAVYNWQNGETGQTVIVNQSGLYKVAVRQNGCVAKDSIQITVIQSPVITISNDTSICQASFAVLTGVGGGDYRWYPNIALTDPLAAITEASPDTTTTYYLTVSNSQCSSTDSVKVRVIKPPIVDLGIDTSFCSLDSLLLFAGNGGTSYEWQDGYQASSYLVKEGGLYHVSVNLDGCVTSDSITITVFPPPTLSISADTTICKSDSITLNSSSSAILNAWYPSHGLSSITEPVIKASPDTTTMYYLTITDHNNCSARDSVNVKVVRRPQVELGQDTAVCSTDSLMLNAGNTGSEFTWQDGQNTQNIIVKDAGLYHVTVSNEGCSAQDSIIITSLTSPQVILSADTTICRTGTAILTGAGGTRYSWAWAIGIVDSTSSTLTISPDTTTSFFLTITGNNGCTARDSVTVTVIPRPEFTVQASKQVACLGDSILLTAAGGNNYHWSPSSSLSDPNGQTTLAYPSSSTSYKVVIENSACQITDSVFIYLPVVDKPQVSITKSNDINCFQGTATLTAGGGASYLWTPSAGLSDSTIRNPIVSISKTATYFVSITTVDGCELMDSITVNVAKGDDGTGFPVPSAFTPNNDGKNDCFSVQHWGEVKDFSLYLFNRWGELIFQADQPTKCWNGIYKGVTQPTGVYVYLIKAKTLCGEIFRKGTVTLIR